MKLDATDLYLRLEVTVAVPTQIANYLFLIDTVLH